MAVTVGQVCAEVHNYFVVDIHSGEFTISNHSVAPLDFIQTDQYFTIVGSIFNDGVYQKNTEGMNSLKDETFTGKIYAMKIPPDFLAAVDFISALDDKYGGINSAAMSPYQSESYAGQYSYTKASGYGTSDDDNTTWQKNKKVKGLLDPYRKVVGQI